VLAVNEKAKAYLQKQNKNLVDALTNNFSVEVYQDEMAEDEEPAIYHFFIYELGDIQASTANKGLTLSQDVFVHYISENRNDLDDITLDVITSLSKEKLTFVKTAKGRHQKGNTDAYVDRVSFSFRRMINLGICTV